MCDDRTLIEQAAVGDHSLEANWKEVQILTDAERNTNATLVCMRVLLCRSNHQQIVNKIPHRCDAGCIAESTSSMMGLYNKAGLAWYTYVLLATM